MCAPVKYRVPICALENICLYIYASPVSVIIISLCTDLAKNSIHEDPKLIERLNARD